MNQETKTLWWATSPSLVGPIMVIVFVGALALAAYFVKQDMTDMAILTCLGALVLMLLGVVDLVAELIMIGRRLEKSLSQKSQ